MTDPVFRSDVSVFLLDYMGDENSIVRRARVSTGGPFSSERNNPGDDLTQADLGLLRMLYRDKHGVPFEGVEFEFYFEVPIFVSRQLVKHRLCLSGDTRVYRADPSGGSSGNVNNTLSKIWENWHLGVADSTRTLSKRVRYYPSVGKYKPASTPKIDGVLYEWDYFDTEEEAIKAVEKFAEENPVFRRRLLAACRDITLMSMDEETGNPVTNKIKDIVKTGVKTTYLVKTSSGKEIRSTMEHRFLTDDGWKQLSEISVGDDLVRLGLVADGEPAVPRRLREAIGAWSRVLRPEKINMAGDTCYVCDEEFSYDALHLDHVIPVAEDLSLALSESNLKPICIDCHKIKTGSEAKLGKRHTTRGFRSDTVMFIGDPKDEETFDVEMEDPHHNFVAESLVVHNSSINEASGRYREMEGQFYIIPEQGRNIEQVGKTSAYEFAESDAELIKWVQESQKRVSLTSWAEYESLLSSGVAKEVARQTLPTNLYSQMYYKTNLRSALNFLSLRKDWGGESAYPSHPQYEITLVADKMAEEIREVVPNVYDEFLKNGMRPV